MPPIECPLQFTQVEADVAGMASRVTVVQTFMNPSRDPIEAIYTFPLPADASVDRMRIKIGDRVVEGEIKPRGEARAIYESARAAGQTAALLDQERPNIFTQSIANVAPGAVVEVEISYISLLKYEDGQYEFDFPMVVGPRNAMHAPDPDSITPPIVYHGMRTGTDVALTVHLNAGTSLKQVGSTLHAININKLSAGRYDITLARKDEIPNRDFILKWTPAGNGVTE
ncbi:MAG TPA: VIT domain-containing protein, partial [Fimbriimonadaceae bacterium]|nr:VIT domain-containing protein [Fimbriimonadaceae bacterium]